MEKLTLHRVLSELKTIDDRINKAINGLDVIAVLRGSRVYTNNGIGSGSSKSESEFTEDAKAGYQSVNDLIKRKFTLRSALMKANSSTIVKVGELELTIVEAIEMKDQIERKKILLTKMKKCLSTAASVYDSVTDQTDKDFERMLNAQISNLTNKSDISRIREEYSKVFYNENKVGMLNPIKLEDAIKTLEAEINEFTVNVDSALSEVNATTVVEIE